MNRCRLVPKNNKSAASNNTIAENEGKADEENNNAEQAGTESIQQLDQKRAMLLIESGVRFHPTT